MGTRAQRFCKQGHEFTPANTRYQQRKGVGNVRPFVARVCRTCSRLATKDYDTHKRNRRKH